jgi:hypothetical protein
LTQFFTCAANTSLPHYAPWPLWGSADLLGEDDLALSETLKLRVKAWPNAYDTNFPRDPSWPMWAPHGVPDDVEAAWIAEGDAIAGLIGGELGDDFEEIYET